MTGTPLLTPTEGFAPGTFLSTEIGRVCASTGDQTCVKTTDQVIRERSLDIMRRGEMQARGGGIRVRTTDLLLYVSPRKGEIGGVR
ncbi:hypothetical protein LMG6000_04080 [Achromobacter insolitus]|uniref:Uncharacterized protein n=1 Tax=Achromobacter insolitus TaxID=217204 RepID=A0A6S7F5H2_9BURK|nr:hypothetical protein LMG6000_04080 [Achromobacter insolitus]CAB3941938.1 hypothetical protein LMG5997_04806 [Achromobacter insolitus]